MNCHTCPESCQHKLQNINWKRLKFWSKNPITEPSRTKSRKTIALVGSPDVGKSFLFNLLTGSRAQNYQENIKEVCRGKALIAGKKVTVLDTPDIYSLIPITEKERVTRDLLFNEPVDLIIHVVDAKNLSRMLPLTFQLMETQLPLLLVVNTNDKAEKLGTWVDEKKLETSLGIPVVTMAATLKVGLYELITKVARYVQPTPISSSFRRRYCQNRVSAFSKLSTRFQP